MGSREHLYGNIVAWAANTGLPQVICYLSISFVNTGSKQFTISDKECTWTAWDLVDGLSSVFKFPQLFIYYTTAAYETE